MVRVGVDVRVAVGVRVGTGVKVDVGVAVGGRIIGCPIGVGVGVATGKFPMQYIGRGAAQLGDTLSPIHAEVLLRVCPI